MAADILLYTEADAELRGLFARERNGDEKELFERRLLAFPENLRWRDPYNADCRLWSLGLSYWRDMVPLLDERMVLGPEECHDFIELIVTNMPPDHGKLELAGAAGTELAYVLENFGPEARASEYDGDRLAWLSFEAGQLAGLLSVGWRGSGVLCSL